MLGDDAILLFVTHDDLQEGVIDVLQTDLGLAFPGGQQSGLVQQVLQIGTGEAHSAAGDGVEGNVVLKGLLAGMNLQDLYASLNVGHADVDLTVKPAGTQQSGVQNIGTVGGCHDDDAGVVAKAIHLHQQLVQGLLTLVVTAAQTGAALTANSVDLVDEDDGRSVLLGLIKQVADTAGAHAHVQLHEVGAGNGEEGYAGLTGNCLCDQGLTGTGRAHQQNALGNTGAQRHILLGLLEEVHNLFQIGLFLVGTCHIPEGDLFLVVGVGHLGAGLAKVHGTAATAALPVHHKEPERTHDDDDHQIGQHGVPDGIMGGLIVHLQCSGVLLGGDLIPQIFHEVVHIGHLIDHLGFVLQRQQDLGVADDQLGDLLLLDGLSHIGISGLGRVFTGTHQQADGHQKHDEEQNIHADAAATAFFLVQKLLHSSFPIAQSS